MKTVAIPIAMLEVGKPLPVDVWTESGQLLLKKGQPIVSEQHRDKLHAFNAGITLSDALAWQRAYERMVHALLRDGVDLQTIATASMPSTIRETDYTAGQEAQGGWLDLQSVLRGILYQGGLAVQPAKRLEGIKTRALALLKADADESLFCLYQALGDNSLGYCATHALLCMVICELTAQKLDWGVADREPLQGAALTMNIAMAREQDSLARQSSALTQWQRTLIQEHPHKSAALLASLGWDEADLQDIVYWHHQPEEASAAPRNLARRRLLHLADQFVAQTAARKTRMAQSAVKAVKSMVLQAQGDTVGLSSAMAQAVGFYPPGSYVQLANGDTAVSAQRGQRANTPWVISIANKDGMPQAVYNCRDSSLPEFAIVRAVDAHTVRQSIAVEKVRRARLKIQNNA
jgi:HD-GYP domain-containing protein (c-di-GMP phosphodiesterase class II)